MLIKPSEEKSYAKVLGDIRAKIKAEETETNIRSIRGTPNRDDLLELGNKTKDLEAFSEALRTTLGVSGTMRNLVSKVTLEFLDLDSVTTKGNAEKAIRRDLK